MLIALFDEPGLFVFATPEDFVRNVEPPDAEDTLRALFDETGVPYRAQEVQGRESSSKLGRFWNLLFAPQPDYRLVPAGPPNVPALIELLEQRLPDSEYSLGTTKELEGLLARLRRDVQQQHSPPSP
jgi:hypothetical protein